MCTVDTFMFIIGGVFQRTSRFCVLCKVCKSVVSMKLPMVCSILKEGGAKNVLFSNCGTPAFKVSMVFMSILGVFLVNLHLKKSLK